GLWQGCDRELGAEDRAHAPVLADDLRARARLAVGRDQDGVRLLPERVAYEQVRCGAPRTEGVAPLESMLGDRGEEVLVEIGQALAVGGEAFVAEALEEIAGVDPDRSLVILIGVARGEPLEPVDIELQGGIATEADRVLVRLEPAVGIDSGRREARADEPQGLTQ